MGVEQLRKLSESLYYSGELQPQTMAEVSTFVRRVGVHPSASAIDGHRKKAQRRLGATGTAIMPFSEVFGFVTACYIEAAKLDPAAAEDQDYLGEVWAHCGGGQRADDGAAAAVPTTAIAKALEDVGLSSEPVQQQRKQAAMAASQRARHSHAAAAVDPDAMTYKDFIELVNAPTSDADARGTGADGADASGGADMYRATEQQEAYRPRLSFVMVMRIRSVIRAFKRRREARLEKERRDRELDAYARRYFGTDIFSPEGPSASRQRRPSEAGSKTDPAAMSRRQSMSGQTASASVSQRPAAGNAIQAARARRNGGAHAAAGPSGRPPLVDERDSAFDRALAAQEAAERRHQREMRQQRLLSLHKSHPRKDGCIDVVRRYAASPVMSPAKQRIEERNNSPVRCGTMGRPKPRALSPTQLRQKATPEPRRAVSRTGAATGSRPASRAASRSGARR